MERTNDYINALVKDPKHAPIQYYIPNELNAFQYLVGGYIEIIPLGNGVLAIVDEEGKLKQKRTNFAIGNDPIAGTVVFVRQRGEEFTDLNYSDFKWLKTIFKDPEAMVTIE